MVSIAQLEVWLEYTRRLRHVAELRASGRSPRQHYEFLVGEVIRLSRRERGLLRSIARAERGGRPRYRTWQAEARDLQSRPPP